MRRNAFDPQIIVLSGQEFDEAISKFMDEGLASVSPLMSTDR